LADISLFEAIRTQRSIRHFSTAPVSDEVVAKMLEAAIRAPSGGNTQPWYFLVIRDRKIKRQLGDWYLRAWRAIVADMSEEQAALESYRSGGDMGHQMENVPVVILVCVRLDDSDVSIVSGSSIYPAVQNLMLAARALGLGTVLTTNHTRYEEEVKRFFGIPDGVATAALIPLGYPAEGERFGGSRRKSLEDVTFYDHWGQHA
jgi:nitroreductase